MTTTTQTHGECQHAECLECSDDGYRVVMGGDTKAKTLEQEISEELAWTRTALTNAVEDMNVKMRRILSTLGRGSTINEIGEVQGLGGYIDSLCGRVSVLERLQSHHGMAENDEGELTWRTNEQSNTLRTS